MVARSLSPLAAASPQLRQWLPSWLLVSGLVAPAALLMLDGLRLEGAARLLLIRDQVLAGELWRLFTGHWVHVTPQHFAWDAIAFLMLGLLCDRASRRAFLQTLVLSSLAISVAVMVAKPDLAFYGGLSGVDSALFGLLAATMLVRNVRAHDRLGMALSMVLIAAFVLKIGYEFVTTACVFVPAVESAVPVPIAHVVGFMVGVLVAIGSSHGSPENSAPDDCDSHEGNMWIASGDIPRPRLSWSPGESSP